MNRIRALAAGLFLIVSALALLRLLAGRSLPEITPAASAPEAEQETRRSFRGSAPAIRRAPPGSRHPSAAPNPETSAPAGAPRQELTGYLIDDFRSWTAIPEGYRADGLRLTNGGLSLEAEPLAEQTGLGTLLSPPLPLRPPPGGRPLSPGRDMPPGSEVELEMRLSRDGTGWTHWNLVDRDRGPDGPFVAAPRAPSSRELEPFRDATTTGPSIQYRLTLRAGSGALPTVRELRIWHDGPAQLEQDLSLHSAPDGHD